jgi:hypothetical protein
MVSNFAEYDEMLQSYIDAGFATSFTEFLYVDNSNGNKADAYQSINYFLQNAVGEYIILCHQDILLCHDKLDKLESCITELDQLDPRWAIMANAGASGIKDIVYRITEPNNVFKRRGNPTQKVVSVDENFILVKRSANLALSTNLDGFHLYGTDLCLIAHILGFNAYVVNFNLLHKSKGNVDAKFYKIKAQLLQKYEAAFSGRFIQTTCTNFYLSGSPLLNKLFNMRLSMFFVRNYFSIKRKLNPGKNEIPKSEW